MVVQWLATKQTITHWVHNTRLTIILPYQLDTTNDLLTSRAGLIILGQLVVSLSLAEGIDKHFPLPNSNRDNKTDSELVYWYCQRAEDSENRIKEM